LLQPSLGFQPKAAKPAPGDRDQHWTLGYRQGAMDALTKLVYRITDSGSATSLIGS